ncbi:hypothetical protein [Roseibaca sp. Y0-43]|uniref:hypothetical protein n=1 Tax=Roseibaca sp. Y0-43 TaxID=2816854 RepID=UPI001D0C075D|nr:hypothetical protein [Roseibaca sp. Y0-43]MCC1482299.1 hypothetical protein [Roseibaca sp. Y0-43]
MRVSGAFLRRLGLVAAIGLLSACASGAKLGEERAELNNFLLGHAIVVDENAVAGPASRKAEPNAWKESLEAELQRRFGRYQGDKLYHLGVAVQGYVLAIPGIPLVAAPKSFLILGVTVWDDAAGQKLNDKPHRIIVFESLSGETAISSGLTQSAEEQMQNLTQNGVAAIERWLATQEEWFPPAPEQPDTQEEETAEAQDDPAQAATAATEDS